MSDPEWIGPAAPGWFGRDHQAYWSADGQHIYFELKRPGERRWDLYRVSREGGTSAGDIEPVDDADSGSVDVGDGNLSPDRSLRVFSNHGDLFVRSLRKAELRQLTRTSVAESSPRFLADGRRIWFRRGGTVFIRDLDSGLESQPFELRTEESPATDSQKAVRGSQKAVGDEAAEKPAFLEAQQERLFDVIRERQSDEEQDRERAELLRNVDPSRSPNPWYLGADVEILRASLAPNGTRMLVVIEESGRSEGPKDTMPSWVTSSGYVENKEVRAKVGTDDGTGHGLLLLDSANHEPHRLELASLPGVNDEPLAFLTAEGSTDSAVEALANGGANDPEASETVTPRSVTIELIEWNKSGSRAALQIHSRDNKDRWIATLDSAHEISVVHRLNNPAWINWYFNEMGWLADGERLWYLSEESGYSHLYLHSLASGETSTLTSGEYVVSEPWLTNDDRYIYFRANREHPGQYELYRVEIATGKIEQVTALGGRNSAKPSPDERELLIVHSTVTRPPELLVQSASPGSVARPLTSTTSAEFDQIEWVEPEIVPVPSSHHRRPIYSRFYPVRSPKRLEDSDGKRPAIIFVHGAGYLQNAHRGWSSYFREFMFHSLLSEHGYVVLDMDYRASAGYGSEWRTAIYRNMGQPELEDLEDGARWLADTHNVDPKRIGVYGGSYGGFLTMMALFKEPDLFACGAALRPVTDWAHYNHDYTSNILNTPETDPEAYQRSSPIEFAAGLERPLLICAPMLDDNVFFQDTVRLAQRLIELEKVDWEVAIFPTEPHGFRRPSSWLNEYRRILSLFERHLRPAESTESTGQQP